MGKRGPDKLSTGLSNRGLAFAFNKGAMGVGYLAEGTSAEGCKVGSADLDRSARGCLTPTSEKGGPISPLAHDDSLRRGEFAPRVVW